MNCHTCRSTIVLPSPFLPTQLPTLESIVTQESLLCRAAERSLRGGDLLLVRRRVDWGKCLKDRLVENTAERVGVMLYWSLYICYDPTRIPELQEAEVEEFIKRHLPEGCDPVQVLQDAQSTKNARIRQDPSFAAMRAEFSSATAVANRDALR